MNRTKRQLEAINATEPEILVIAGPGSGKTSTMVGRMHRLIDDDFDPTGFVVLTFTNAAAREIEKRVQGAPTLNPHDPTPIPRLGYSGTLHGFALKILKQIGTASGYGRRMGIIGEDSANELLAGIADRLRCKLSVDDLAKMKTGGRPVAVGGRLSLPETVVATYYDELAMSGLVDFDVLLVEFLRFLRRPDSKALFRELGYTHLFVDEVQDSAPSDWAIYDELPIANKFLVGDPDQAIYSFRGGSVDELVRRAEAAKTTQTSANGPIVPARLVLLEENFRSVPEICEAAQRLIERGSARVAKKTLATRGSYAATYHLPAGVCGSGEANSGEEAAKIGREITTEFKSGTPVSEIAVLARSNAIAFELSKELAAAGVPVKKREEPKVPRDWAPAIKLVELLVNPFNDLLAYFYAATRFGKDWANEVRRKAAAEGKPIRDFLSADLPLNAKAHVAPRILQENGVSLEASMIVAEKLALLDPNADMIELAAILTAKAERGAIPPEPAVEVLTIHSAKGREWDVVILAGFEDEVIPSHRKDANVEEERRVAYVAITRARDRLYVHSAASRAQPWGAIEQHEPSRFLAEMSATSE